MATGITTSIRLDPELRNQLDAASRYLHHGKNWIISQALREYLAQMNRTFMASELKKQSLVVSRKKTPEEKEWQDAFDDSDWE